MKGADDPSQTGIASGPDAPSQTGIASGPDAPSQTGIASGPDDPSQTGIASGANPANKGLPLVANEPPIAFGVTESRSRTIHLDVTPFAGAVAEKKPAPAAPSDLLEVFGAPKAADSSPRGVVDPLGATGESSFRFGAPDGASAAALMETFVVPRYLAPAGEMLLELLAVGESAQIVHVGCGTGFPDATLLERMPGSELYGCDPSAAAVHLAQAKAAAAGLTAEYLISSSTSTPLPSGAFTHAITLDLAPEARAGVFREMQRLLAPGGQLLVTLLLRGSAQELTCLLREYAVASDRADLSRSLDLLSAARPTPEAIVSELEGMGFQYVEVEHRRMALSFRSGRDFLEDPVCRMLLFPETERLLRLSLAPALEHVRTAVDRYWSTGPFDLVLSVGCVSARRAL